MLAEISILGLDQLPDKFQEEIVLQGLRLVATLIVLAASWLVGQRIVSYWEIRKRIRESDLEAERTFQKLHGEFKALWRIWKVHAKRVNPESGSLTLEAPHIWDLVDRASVLEGEFEALLLKLASSRSLSEDDRRNLGLLRQLIQQLREGMKRGSKLDEDFRLSDYQLFHTLSAGFLEILRRPCSFQSASETDRQVRDIVAVRPGDLSATRPN